jgi:probable HAF family extracellular repeat protein
MLAHTSSFRCFTCFAAFLLVWAELVDSGWGQQVQPPVPTTPVSARTGPVSPIAPRSAPLVQTSDYRAVISVSPTLSSLTVSGVVNNTLTITYNVYNLRSDPVDGILVTTALQSGVTFQSATPAPDRNGQQLAFSLGSLPPSGSTSAQLTVRLASNTTVIDGGTTAFGYWNGIAVQATGVAATLRTGTVDPTLLQSTDNANLSDTYITGQAAALGNNPTQIFQFVRDQIGYESYTGALRGARGTLWSMAGNSLDKASLLVALLRASGIPAQYVSGTLSQAQAKQIILSMFPPQIQLTGYVPNSSTLSDPGDDPTLQAEVEPHYWVQFDPGTGFVNADPDFAGAAIGQTFTASTGTFADVPANLNFQVTVNLNAEIYQQGFFGPIFNTSTPLTQSFTSAALVGHPLSLGHLVQSQTAGLVISATTNNYTPYLVVGQNDLTPGDDPMITGQQYQEVLTNFPFGSQILTGLFLEFVVTTPAGTTTTYTHTIVDRIGYAARQGLVSASVTLPAGGAPAVGPLDSFTIGVDSSLSNLAVGALLATRDQQLQAQLTTVSAGLNPTSTSPANQAQMQQALAVGTQRMMSLTQAVSFSFQGDSDQVLPTIASAYVTKAYLASPRITVASAQISQNGSNSIFACGFDRTEDVVRSLPFPGQAVSAGVDFQFVWGLTESAVESQVMAQLEATGAGATLQTRVTAADVFQAAKNQGIGLIVVNSASAQVLATSNYSANAQAYMNFALAQGKTVIVPSQNVMINGVQTVSWYEVDPATGATTDTGEDGNHQAIVTYAAQLLAVTLVAGFVGFSALKIGMQCFKAGNVSCGLAAIGVGAVLIVLLAFVAGPVAQSLAALLAGGTLVGGSIDGAFIGGAGFAAAGGVAGVFGGAFDPPVDPMLNGAQPPVPFGSPNIGRQLLASSATRSGGAVAAAQLQLPAVRIAGSLTAGWSSSAAADFPVTSVSASNATLTNSSGQTVGTGSVMFVGSPAIPSQVSGAVTYSLSGQGEMDFYGPAAANPGVSGNWTGYSATLTGAPALTLTTSSLLLNGSPLPAGTYTISAVSLTLAGSGAGASPDFAGSASVNVTAGILQLDHGSGALTLGGSPIDPSQGVALNAYTGSVSVTGAGAVVNVTLSGTASQALRVFGNPASVSANQDAPTTFTFGIDTTLADTYNVNVEAPPGWTVSIATNGTVSVTPGSGSQSGVVPVFLTAVSQTTPALVAQAAVMVTIGSTAPGVSLTVTTDSVYTVPVSGAQLPSAFRATIENLGPAADTFALSFPVAPSGFTVPDSVTAPISIPPGSTAIVGLYLTPVGALPSPDTVVPFTVAATSTSNPSITASQALSFTVPAVQALTLQASPSQFAGTPGTPVQTTLTINSVGNVSVTASLSSILDSGLSLSGMNPTLSLGANQSTTEMLTLTGAATAVLGTPLTAYIQAAFGNQQTATTAVTLNLSATQAEAASAGAQYAANIGRPDIAVTLSGLGQAIDTAISACSPAAQSQVLAYLNNLIQEMNAPYLASLVAPLQSAQSVISAATCANIAAALTQLSTVLSNLASVLNSSAAYPFSLSLVPNTALASPGQATVFPIALQNQSNTTNTYNLTLNPLPSGVTGSLSTASVTLAPGASVPVNNAMNNPSVSITPSTGTAFQFSVTATINGVAGGGQTAYGTLTARSTFLAVEDVKATPAFTNADGSVDVVTHIANIVNTDKTVNVSLAVLDSGNNVKATANVSGVQLNVQTLLTTVDFGQINTTGFVNGNYSLAVTVIDPATNLAMPGGTGTGTLLVGSPVTATLTASPQTLAPGNGSVTSTLNVSTTNGGNGNSQFTLIGSLATASAAQSVAVNGTTVYSCDENEVSVINAADPTNPTLAGTALAGALNNAGTLWCSIQGGDLVMFVDTGNSGYGNSPSFVAFDLTNPTSPSQIGSTVVNKRFFNTPYYQGNTAFFTTFAIFVSGSSITGQAGDVVSLDITNLSNPAILGTLETPVPANEPQYGGAFNAFGLTPYNSELAYATSTTSQGVPNGTGTGQLWVVDTSNPSSMSMVTQVNVPGTVQLFGPLVQGNTAVAIGDSGGWQNPFVTGAFAGTVVVAVFDTTNPQSPQIVANVPTTFLPGGTMGYGSAVIGPNLFLYAGIIDASNNNYLMLVDTTNPASPVITTFLVPQPIKAMTAVGTLLYAPTPAGLQIYSIPGTGAIQYTAAVQIANNSTVTYNANSFSVPPTSTTPGTGFDTVTWVNPPSNTITWSSSVTGIQAGQVLPIDPGATVSFNVPLGSGTITVPQADVNAGNILGLNPATQTVTPGVTAAYSLIVNNPTASAVNYTLAVTGLNPGWVTLPSSANVPASGQVTIPLNLNSGPNAAAGTFAFTATATAGGASASVQGTLILQGTGTIGSLASTNALGVSVSLIPVSATGGQATPTQVVAQLTNTGNVTDTYTLSVTAPPGMTATLAQSSVQVPPGLTSFRQVALTLTAAPGTAPGPIGFTVNATSMTNASTTGSAAGTLNLLRNGVSVALSPPSGPPGTTFVLTVTNQGTVSDTFNLALGGPASTVATLASTSVTLAPQASQNVNITTASGSAFTLGALELLGQAVSAANSSVNASATALLTISTRSGVSASFNPATQTLAAPGPAVFLLKVLNTGAAQDTYSAAITSVTGPVTASLTGLDGNPTQTVSGFILPGVGEGQLVLNATLTSLAVATVTVQITSLSNPAESVFATATIAQGSLCDVNGDGNVNIIDIQMMINEALGTDRAANDLNGDGVVNVVDIQIDINGVLMLGCEAGAHTQTTATKPQSLARRVAPSAIAVASPGTAARPAGITDLGTLGGTSATVYSLNDLGQVVGSSETGQTRHSDSACPRCRVIHAFLWEAGQMKDLDSGDAGNSAAYSINNAVQIAGVYSAPGSDTSGFLYAAGNVTVLNQAAHGRANAINNAGQIVGDLSTGLGPARQAFVWNAGRVLDLGTLGGLGSEARAINDSGQVAGWAHLDSGVMHAFLYSGTGLTDLGTLGGKNSVAYGLNNAGEVVGMSQTGENGVQHAFLYKQLAMIDLSTLGGNESQANGINDSGWIVGWSRTSGGEQRAFLWRTGRMVDLNSLVSAGPGIWLEEATAINAAGQIAANASDGHAYLITLPLEPR